jgi:hypothetical protein
MMFELAICPVITVALRLRRALRDAITLAFLFNIIVVVIKSLGSFTVVAGSPEGAKKKHDTERRLWMNLH